MNWKLHAGRAGYVDFVRQQDTYEAITGDRPEFFGFAQRLATWCDKNPRESLTTTRGE